MNPLKWIMIGVATVGTGVCLYLSTRVIVQKFKSAKVAQNQN